MAGRDAGVGKSDASVEGGQHHLAPGLEIPAVERRHAKPGTDPPQRLFGEEIAEGGGLAARVGLQGMAEGVHSRRSRHLGRHGEGQLGVEEAVVGEELVVVDAALDTVAATDENGREGDFRPRPGRRGNHDFGDAGVFDESQSLIVGGGTFVGDEDADGLGHVHAASSAEADDELAVLLAGQLGDGVGRLHRGLGFDAGEKTGLDAGLGEMIADPVGQPQSLHCLVGDEDGP